MSPKNPDWLPEVRDFCRRSSIVISGWGADTLIVEAKSDARAEEAASLLRQFGFTAMPSDDDKEAGLLLLSRNPEATRSKQAQHVPKALSRRPLNERITSFLEILIPIVFFADAARLRPPASWWLVALGAIAAIAVVWDISRLWTWRLEVSPEELRVRRYFRWSVIPWSQIRSLETGPARSRGSNREIVSLTLTSNARFRLGVFGYPFAQALRDRLRSELAQRRPSQP